MDIFGLQFEQTMANWKSMYQPAHIALFRSPDIP
jgi:hypothetical protein